MSIAANTAGMTMRERVREVAVLKAVGLTARQVLMLYMTESIMVSLAGGAAGALFSYVIFKIGGMLLHVGPLSYFEVPASTVAIGVLVALAIGVISSAWPCWRVARLSVATALATV
jgi:putative ABC transport system permease protein